MAVAGPAGWVRERWQEADRRIGLARRDYWLNLAFFEGRQWVWWSEHRREVVDWAPREQADDRVRLTINVLQPNLINLLAKLTKRPLSFEVLPSAADDPSIGGARLAEKVLEASRIDQGWEEVRYEELFGCLMGATSAVAVEWDGKAGEKLGQDESGRVIGTGEVQLTPLSIPEFTLEPGTRRPRDARWWIMARALPPAQVRERYGLSATPTADAQGGTASPYRRSWGDARSGERTEDLTTVLTYYERPTDRNPKGRMLVVVGEEAVEDHPWPFPFKDRLNLRVFRQQKIPGRWTGHTFVSDAVPLQVAYNAARSTLSEHMKKAAMAKLMYPDTVPEYIDGWDDDPGKPMPFDGTTKSAPHWLEPPHLDRWITTEPEKLRGELDDLMHLHAISRGEAPGDRNSGLALSVLAEKDETPLGLMAHDQAEGWAEIASMILELYAAKVTESRTARVETEAGNPLDIEWNGARLMGQTKAKVPLDATMPQSRAATHSYLQGIVQNFPMVAAQLDMPMLLKVLDLPGIGHLGTVVDADVARAQRENHLMSAGKVSLPEKFDDHAKHIAEHNRDRKSASYENATPEVREVKDLHIQAHEKMAAEEMAQQLGLNAVIPGLGAMPQANEPIGSAVPPDFAEQQAQMALGPGPMPGGPPQQQEAPT